MEEEKTVTLRPVLALHGYAVDFSQKPGKMTYRFCVKSGEVEIHHHSYDGAAGFWCLPPLLRRLPGPFTSSSGVPAASR